MVLLIDSLVVSSSSWEHGIFVQWTVFVAFNHDLYFALRLFVNMAISYATTKKRLDWIFDSSCRRVKLGLFVFCGHCRTKILNKKPFWFLRQNIMFLQFSSLLGFFPSAVTIRPAQLLVL